MVCRGGPWPSRGTLRRRGVCGTMQASSPTWLCYNAGPRFPRLAAGLPWFVGEGFIPPAEPCAAANRADMESAPTGACGSARPAVFRRAAMLAPARRAGVHARRTLEISKIAGLRRRGVPGTMQASCPTCVRVITRGCGSPVGRGPAVVRRGGIYPSRGRSRRRGVRRDEGIPPYGHPGGVCPSHLAGCSPRFVGEGHGPPAGPCPAAGSAGRCKHRPLHGWQYHRACGFPVGRYVGPGL